MYSSTQQMIRLFLLAFSHSLIAPLTITPSTALLLRTSLYNLDGSKGFPLIRALANPTVMATFWGMLLAQIMLLGAIYSPILYALCVRPHLWCLLFWPYLFAWLVSLLWTPYPSLNLYAHSGTGAYITDRESNFNLFLQSFFRTACNPVVLSSPVFSRVLMALFFRYSDRAAFVLGALIGCLGGHFMLLLLSCCTVYSLARSAPNQYRGFVVLYYDFFRYFSFIYIFFSLCSEHGSMIGLHELPLVQLDSTRLRNVWPNIFFFPVTWTRPLWYPIYREAEGGVEEYIAQPEELESTEEDPTEIKIFDPHPSFVHWKHFSEFFFNQCAEHGKVYLAHNYPESVVIANDSLETVLDLPFLSEEDPKALHKIWLQALITRRNDIYLAVRSRRRAANLLRKPFYRVAERKQKSVTTTQSILLPFIRTKLLKKQYKLLSTKPLKFFLDIRLIGRLLSRNWDKAMPATLWRLDPQLTGRIRSDVHRLPLLPPLSASALDDNRFKNWIDLQAKELNHSVIYPWGTLSAETRKVLPTVLKNWQAGSATHDLVANTSNLSWQIFVDVYDNPRMPVYPAPDTKIDFWKMYFYCIKHALGLFKEWIFLKLNRIQDIRQEKAIILQLKRLHKTFPFLNMRGFQMVNQQTGEPDIGYGYLPISKRFNKKVSGRSMMPRRRNLQAGNWFNQRAPLSPLLNYWWQKQTKFSLLRFIVSLFVPVEKSPSPQYFHNRVARYVFLKLTRGTAFDDLTFIVEIMNRVRGPWLLMVAYLRRYVKVPVYIITKHLVRTILRHESELEADLTDWNREQYIICDYAGDEPVNPNEENPPTPPTEENAATETMTGNRKLVNQQPKPTPPSEGKKDEKEKREWPEKWWAEGLQVKVVNPVRLRPWRVSDEDRRIWIRMDLEDLIDECRQELKQDASFDLDALEGIIGGNTSGDEITFIGIWGQELEHPGGNMVKLPDFWAPIIDSTWFLIHLKLSIVWHAIKSLPVWRLIGNKLSWAFQKLLVLPLRKLIAVVQATGRLINALTHQLTYYVHQASIKLKRSIPSKKIAKVEIATVEVARVRSPEPTNIHMVPSSGSKPSISQAPQRHKRPRTTLHNYLHRSPVIRHGLITRFALLEPLPRSVIKSVAPSKHFKLNLHSKWLQLKILWIQIRKCLIFVKLRTWLALKVELPIWFDIQLRLLPIRMKHLRRRVLDGIVDVFDWFIESGFYLYHQLSWRYLTWRFGSPEPPVGQVAIQTRPFELSLAYMLHKLWESKRSTCHEFGSELEGWEAHFSARLKKPLVDWWEKDRILAVCLPYLIGTKYIPNQGLVWSKREWMIWLRNTPHYAPSKTIWKKMLKLPGKLSKKALCKQISAHSASSGPIVSASEWTLSTLHKRWVKGAKKWARRYRFFKLIKQYTTIGHEGGQHRRLMFARQVALPTYVKMFGHFQLGKDAPSVLKKDNIRVNKATEPYFLFAPHQELFNERVPEQPDDLVDELITIGRDYPYWFRQGYRSMATGLYNLLTDMPEEEKELKAYLHNKPSVVQRLILIFKFFYGKDLSSKNLEEKDLDSLMDMMGGEWTPQNWQMHLMHENIFTYNFLAPLFVLASEKAKPRALGAFYHDRIQWLLDKAVKLQACRLHEQLMLEDTQREFRVLTLLNLKEPLPPYTHKDPFPHSRLVLRSESDLLDRFLWPSHRFENLACMNRFWLGTANQSKFSMLRIRMYPLVKP